MISSNTLCEETALSVCVLFALRNDERRQFEISFLHLHWLGVLFSMTVRRMVIIIAEGRMALIVPTNGGSHTEEEKQAKRDTGKTKDLQANLCNHEDYTRQERK